MLTHHFDNASNETRFSEESMSAQAQDLSAKISQLQTDRQRHAAAIAAIDQALDRVREVIGAIPESSSTEARQDSFRLDAASGQLRSVRHKGKFAQTAEVSVLEFVRRMSAPTTAQINEHWRGEGRCGTANVTILKLLHQGMIRRITDPSVRGSRYAVLEAVESLPSYQSETVPAMGA
jgi:hypothetical protein